MKQKTAMVGGQALIEGVLMKGPERTAIAVRTPDKSIDISYIEEKHLKDSHAFFALPLIRGAVNFVESMIMGYRALMISAEKSGMAELEETENDKKSKKGNNAFLGGVMVLASVLGVVLALFLFLYLPACVFDLINYLSNNILSNAVRPIFEGILKIGIFLAYIAAVGSTKDIRRVFMYHGSEHKSIFCYENGLELTVENVRKQSRFHPRCGTSFMIIMLVVGMLFSFVTVTLFPSITKYRVLWVVIKLLLVPLVCGLGYELIRICGKYHNPLTRAISAPGMWVQRLTTKEPDDDMIEVAIASLKAVLPEYKESPEEESENKE